MAAFRTLGARIAVRRLIFEVEGQALVEYSLLISLIAIVAIASVATFGVRVEALFSHIVSVYP